jgi:hypothetical protein
MPDESEIPEEQEQQPVGEQLRMMQPQMLPEIVHVLQWPDPEGNAGVCLLVSNPQGQSYHFWPHEMALQIASNMKKAANTGPGLVKVESKLVLPNGARL